MLTLDLMHRLRVVQRLKETLSQGAFATSRRPVEEHMWEIFALCELFEDRNRVVVNGLCILETQRAVLFDPQFLLKGHLALN